MDDEDLALEAFMRWRDAHGDEVPDEPGAPSHVELMLLAMLAGTALVLADGEPGDWKSEALVKPILDTKPVLPPSVPRGGARLLSGSKTRKSYDAWRAMETKRRRDGTWSVRRWESAGLVLVDADRLDRAGYRITEASVRRALAEGALLPDDPAATTCEEVEDGQVILSDRKTRKPILRLDAVT